uniref:MKRN2 opposite strand n=1 Tax=Equus caballus TaxID=9796 RepID=F6QR05_HORSE
MQHAEAGKPLIKFNHCKKCIYSFSVPRCCPLCRQDMGSRRLEEAPVSIANPFTNGHQEKCSFLLRPTQGTFLREYDGRSDLHVGITNTNDGARAGFPEGKAVSRAQEAEAHKPSPTPGKTRSKELCIITPRTVSSEMKQAGSRV